MKKQFTHAMVTPNVRQKSWDLTDPPGNEICLSPRLLALIRLRVALIHGCQLCIDTNVKALRAQGESSPRIQLVKSWRGNHLYDRAEQAAMALTEALSVLPSGPVPSRVVREARNHFNEAEIVHLVLNIFAANDWNYESSHPSAGAGQRRPSVDPDDKDSRGSKG